MSESLLNWDAYMQVASLSDIGMRRTNNQDNLSVSMASSLEQWRRRGHLFIVADGMGAHAAGELASKLAVDHIPHLYSKFDDISAPEALKKSVIGANTEIHRRGQANEDFHNMGTTCSVLTLLPQGAVVAHIGDSRVYRLRKNVLEQLTFDHSLVWEMKASGQLSPEEEMSGKIPKNVITRSLGPYPECKVDVEGPFPIEVDDVFLLCSDGLTGQVEDAELGAIMANLSPDEAVRVLVDLSNLRGGPDNITRIIIKITHQQLATSTAAHAVPMNSNKKISVNPITWAFLVAAGLGTILFFFMTNWMTAIIPGVVFLGSLIWLLVQLVGTEPHTNTMISGRRFGRGPYVQVPCGSDDSVVDQLRGIADQLREGGQDWDVDWDTLNDMYAEAEQARGKNLFSKSIQIYGRWLSFLMDQLRNQDENGSSIDL